MNELKRTGGARIGWANASWPFAKLSVNADQLILNATIIGKYTFLPEDIISIEPYKPFPVIGNGIRINHRVGNYSSKIIFWTWDDPSDLIKAIKQTGFLTENNSSSKELQQEIAEAQSKGGFPMKIGVAIAIVVIWNLLMLTDFRQELLGWPKGTGKKLALSFMVLTGVLLLISSWFQKIALKKGRNIRDIRIAVLFIIAICGILLGSSFGIRH